MVPRTKCTKHMCRVRMDAHLSDEDEVLERQT